MCLLRTTNSVAKGTLFAIAACATLSMVPASARDRHAKALDVAVVDAYGGGAAFGYSTPFPVQPYSGRTVNQEYCGRNPEPCRQYSTTFQPYAPPVFYRIR